MSADRHLLARIGWLRAAVLGANDGILSTAGLVLGVAASGANPHTVMVSGVAALVAGACSMAAGEFVSVSAQADTEKVAIEHEQASFSSAHEGLGCEYIADATGALVEVRHDAAAELGLSEEIKAKPVQAALASAGSFSLGAVAPLAFALGASPEAIVPVVAFGSLVALAGLGALGAIAGEADVKTATLRVTLFGAAVMAITSYVGHLFGVVAS